MTKVASCLDDSPAGTVNIINAGTAIGAYIRVDNIPVFTLDNGIEGAFVETGAAFDAVFGNFIGQRRLLKTYDGLQRELIFIL